MIYINGVEFYEKPRSCGSCGFFFSGSSSLVPESRGFCALFDETHQCYINPPARCQKLFNKAFKQPDGSRLVVVAN